MFYDILGILVLLLRQIGSIDFGTNINHYKKDKSVFREFFGLEDPSIAFSPKMPDASRESNSTDSTNLTSPLENLSKLSCFKMQGKIRLPLKSQFEAADLPNPGRVVTSAKNMRNVFGLRLTQGAVRDKLESSVLKFGLSE